MQPVYVPPQVSAAAASDAEAIAGSSTTKMVVPANLPAAVPYHAGPVVNGRAPRQGLVFDGTAQGSTPSLPALGTTYTVALWLRPENVSGTKVLLSNSTRSVVYLDNAAVTTPGPVATGISLTANKAACVVLSNSAGTMTPYLNGVALANITQSVSIEAGVYLLGGGGSAYFSGGIFGVLVYNRALSAAEVLALYESGAPSAADYNNASNTTMFGAANWVNASGFTGFSSASPDAFSATSSSAASFAQQNSPLSVVKGRKYRFSITANAGAQTVFFNAGGNNEGNTAQALSATGGTVEITAAATGTSYLTVRFGTGFTTASASYLYPLGLLLAPETNAPGNGYQWKDMSGNRADILLPLSGVSWALPDRRPNSYRETLTWSADNTTKYLGSVNHTVPPGGVVRDVVVKSTASTTGSGFRLSTFNVGGAWVASTPLTANVKKICTVAGRIPGAAAADADMAVLPDSVAFTGSITTEVFWDFAGDS